MRHIPQESIAEFVRETLPSADRRTVQKHVAECRECSEIAGMFRKVARVGSHEAVYEPPPGIVRAAKAYFGTQQDRVNQPAGLIELLFDSLAQPAAAGARASVASARQLLYRVGTVYVDMRVDSEV